MWPLAEYLLSDQPLGPKEREKLARRLPKGTHIGRPRNHQIRGASHLARLFYERLREKNKADGIRDHGHCDNMKCYAARATVEDWFAYDFENDAPRSQEGIESFAGQVREFMDKAKSRREGVDKAIVSFPAPAWWPRRKNRQKL
jgi:hypothetical protein